MLRKVCVIITPLCRFTLLVEEVFSRFVFLGHAVFARMISN